MSLSLYTLTGQYQELARLAADATEPEDVQSFVDTMEGLDGMIDDKVNGCAAIIRTLLAEEEAVTREIERLEDRCKALTNNRNRLKVYVQQCMEAAGKDKVKGPLFTVAIQANPARAVVDDEAALPDIYWKTTRAVSTADINKALKAGTDVPGAHLEQSRSLRIR